MQFVCRLGTPDGRVVEEVHTATDEAVLRGELERRGYHLFEVRRRGFSLSLPRLRRRGKGIPTQEFLIFNQELAALLRAGLPLLQALGLMLERMREGRMREVLADVRERVKSGEELSEAFAAYGDLFPRLYSASLRAGERSGELERVIRRFIRYLKLVMEARKRIFSALVYPAVLVGLSVAMIAVMSLYVLPRFEEFFGSMEIELPLITRITLAFSTFAAANFVPLLLAVGAAVYALRRWSRTEAGKASLDRLKLRLPFLGPVLHRFALSEFCRSVATLLSGGIPLVPSFEIATEAVGNAYIRRQLVPSIQRVREGEAFHRALEESDVFTPMALDMVKVGEATGALDEMLGNVSDFFDEQVETRMQRLLSLLEPLMLVFLGLIIALLLVSIYLPMFSSLGRAQ